MKRINIFAVMFLFAISFLANDIFAQRQGNRNFGGQRGGFWSQLNEEQKQELQEKIKGLRDAGASKDEVQQAISSLLDSYGIDQSQAGRGRGGFGRIGRGPLAGLIKDLDDNQKQAVQEKHKELRDAGKTPKEIHTEIGTLLQSFGVELPDNWEELQGQGQRSRGMRGGFSADLTEDQRTQIQDKQKELRDAGKTPEEAHTEIGALLQSFGIELPDNWGEMQGKGKRGRGFRGRGSHPGFGMKGGFSAELSEDQKEAIQTKMKELREQQVSREEIHKAVGGMLQSFGVELPYNWEDGPQGRKNRGPRGRFWKQLNEEQKTELREMIESLKDNGATKKEIHESVNAKLKGFGIEPSKGRRGNQVNQNESDEEELDAELEELEASNFPNPFNPETSIVYTLKNQEKVSIRIYNANGQLVRTLLDSEQSSGTHTVLWNGRNDNGQMATSGMYFYRIDAGANSLTQGMILMK